MKKTTTHSNRLIEKRFTSIFIRSLLFFLFILGIQNSFAQTNTWDGSSSNSWNTAANWSLNHVPTAAEDVVIPNVGTNPRYAVTSTTVKSITITNGGSLIFERATAYSLTVTGNVTVNTGGSFTMRTAGTSATSTLTVGGDFVNNGLVDFVETSLIGLVLNGSSTQTISGTGTTTDLHTVTLTNTSSLVIDSAIDVNSNWINNGKTVSGTGSVTFGGTSTIGGTTSTAFPNLIIAGTVTQAINTTVLGDYTQTGGTYNQNAGATAYSLIITGNFGMSGGVFNMQTTANGAGATTTVNGATGTTLSGTARIAMDSGGAVAANVSIFQTTNFTSSSTANSSTGIIDFGNEANTKNNQFRISGNCTKTGSTGRFYTSEIPVNGGLVFNGSGTTQLVSIAPSSSTEYYNVTINSGAVVQLTSALTLGTASNPASSLTVNGTLDAQAFSPAILGGNSGTLLFANGSTLITANTNGVVSGTTGTISTSVGTRTFVTPNYIFDGAANQTANFGNLTMNNLTVSNTGGSLLLNAAPTVNGTLAVTSGTLDSAGFQIIGNATNNFTLAAGTTFRTSGGTAANFPTLFTSGHCNFNAASTVEYYGTTQTVSATPTYGNLSLSASGTKTAGGALTIAGTLNIASGAIANLGSTTTHTANTLTLGGLGTAAGKFGSTGTSAALPNVYKNNTYFTAGTTGYITIATGTCVAPTINFGTIPSICQGATSVSIPYTAITGGADLYTISGTGITAVTNGALAAAPSSIAIGLSPAAPGTISPSVFNVSSSVTGCISANISGSITVNTTVGTPSAPSPAATTICQASSPTVYTTSATNATSYTWSVTGSGNSISGTGTTGTVTWASGFSGTATVSVVANGCNGPSASASTTVIVTPTVGTPGTPSPSATTICQASTPTDYTTSATNATSYIWTVSGTGNTISGTGTTGTVTWSPTYSGTATISVRANGCNGPSSLVSTTVTVTPTVGNPSFTSGSQSLCQNAANTTYTATATNSTGITYSVLPVAAGVIGSGSGIMDWDANYSGSATITATVTGCNGPKTVDRVVTITPTVGTPNFTAGATTVCQDAVNTTYTATATDTTGITYSVSPGTAGVIGSTTGIMNWSATFSGTATITASAAGCNGPKTNTRSVTVTPTVGATNFTAGPLTVCQDAPNSIYTATATNSTGITYSVTPSAAGEIDSETGEIDWDSAFSGNATITALAAGCNGPTAANRVVTVTPTVGTPIFSSGATTVCQDAANTTYTASASNSTGITYSVSPPAAGTIGSSSGIMDWNSSFNGTATIIASATGCNGPKTANRLVVVNPNVGTPGFLAGATTVCQDAPDETYTASAPGATGITYAVSPLAAGTIGASSGIMNWNPSFSGTATITASAAGCNGPKTANRVVTVNALPVVTASNVTGCSGSSIALSGSATPTGGSGNYSVANPYVGTSSTTYTYTYTDLNGCTNTSAPANITITPQPLWYLDADGDQYYTGAAIPSCTSPGAGYTTSVLGGNDCNDNDTGFNPGATDICYNNIDENCNAILSDGCAPVIVNMTASYDNTTLSSLSLAIPAVSYTYPGTTNIKYRFSVRNLTTNTTAPDIIQTSRYITIPASIHSYNSQYTIKVSAVINDEVVAFAGNTITVNSPAIQLVTLSTSNCGATLASLTSTLSANPGLNATGYTFRIRLNDANPNPTYAYSQSATRFVGANSFTGFPLQYATSYKISVQYTSTDASTNSPVQSGYGAECIVNTPSIPLISLASPTCGSQVAATNANISAGVAAYATSYQFRIRLFSDNGPNPTYYYTVPNASRFSSLASFQGITYAYNTNYVISVQYSILNGSSTLWSGYGPACTVKTPFFPVTSLIPNQCGKSTPTDLNEQLNITPYPGFPHYKVLLEEIAGEDVVNSEEKEIAYSHFKLSDFSIAQLGKSYAVSVAIKLNGVFGDYDTACDLFTPEVSKTNATVSFKATAYPNPFANNFMLDLKTSSQSSVSIKVYDMVGRLMEQRNVSAAEMQSTTIGNNYPSGVYNLVVSQEDSVQTIRVVKR